MQSKYNKLMKLNEILHLEINKTKCDNQLLTKEKQILKEKIMKLEQIPNNAQLVLVVKEDETVEV